MLFTESSIAQGVTAGIGVIIISAIYELIALVSRSNLPLPYSIPEVLGQALVTAVTAGLFVKLFIAKHQTSRNW